MRWPFKVLGALIALFVAIGVVLVLAFPADDPDTAAPSTTVIASTAGADAVVCGELGVVFTMAFEGFSLEESLALGLTRGWPYGEPRQEVRRVILEFETLIELTKEESAGLAAAAQVDEQATTLGAAMRAACPEVAERVLDQQLADQTAAR